jgi:hypothetical protein
MIGAPDLRSLRCPRRELRSPNSQSHSLRASENTRPYTFQIGEGRKSSFLPPLSSARLDGTNSSPACRLSGQQMPGLGVGLILRRLVVGVNPAARFPAHSLGTNDVPGVLQDQVDCNEIERVVLVGIALADVTLKGYKCFSPESISTSRRCGGISRR